MKQVIHTDSAPAAIGPYSQAIQIGDLLFVSGQVPIDPSTGAIVEGDVKAQAQQSLNNLKAILNAAGTNMGAVVKTTVFLGPSPPAPPSRRPACPRTPRWRSRPSPSCKTGKTAHFPLAFRIFL